MVRPVVWKVLLFETFLRCMSLRTGTFIIAALHLVSMVYQRWFYNALLSRKYLILLKRSAAPSHLQSPVGRSALRKPSQGLLMLAIPWKHWVLLWWTRKTVSIMDIHRMLNWSVFSSSCTFIFDRPFRRPGLPCGLSTWLVHRRR